MREGRAAVVLQRTEHWISVDLIAGAGQHTAAVVAGNTETSQRIVDVVFGALAQALPGLIPAASCGTMSSIALGGEGWTYYETIPGGSGWLDR